VNIEFFCLGKNGAPGPTQFRDVPAVPPVGAQVWIDGVEPGTQQIRRRPYRVIEVAWDLTDEEPMIEVILE
jgi:hypothetical protein